MSALRGLLGCWVLVSAALIEFYARRYEYSGTPLFPHGVLAIAALGILFLPPRLTARIPVSRQAARMVAVGIVCAAALLFAAQRSLQLVHVSITSGLLAIALAGIAPLRVLPAATRCATALALATLSFAVLAYYAILVIGLETWNQVVSRELLWTYARQLPELVAAMPIGAWMPWGAGAALFIALFLAYWAAAPGIWRGVRAVRSRIRGYLAPAGSMPWSRAATLVLVLGSAALLADPLFRVVAYGRTPDPMVRTFFVDQGPHGTPRMPFLADPAHDALEREAAARYAAPGRVAGKTLVLITVDALRADQMNVYGHARDNTPFLSRLHREGRLARFDNAFAACTESHCGLLAILGARSWHELGTGRQRFGLADVLKRLGYRNHFLLGGDHTNFYDLRSYYGESVDEYIDGASSTEYMNDDLEVIGWLARLDASGAAPRFIYLHFMSVHLAGKRYPQYKVWYRTEAGASGIKDCCSMAVHYANNYHDGILQTDAMIEKSFGVLRAKGLLKDAVVAITADHGENLGDGGGFGHGGPPLDGVVRVPLLIYDTDAFAYPAHALASVTDVAPTLLDRIGAPIPQHWSGRPLSRPAERRFVLMQSRDRIAVVGSFGGELMKYYQHRDGGAGQLVKLAGAGAEHAVSSPDEHREVLLELRGELDRRLPALRREP
jgi:hypothetical protein